MSKLTNKDIVDIKLVNGKRVRIKKGNIIGYCNNLIHKGGLTAELLMEHKCLERQCKYFKKRDEAIFWLQKEIKEKKKEENKAKKKEKTLEKKEQQENLNLIKRRIEKIARKEKFNIVITSVKKTSDDEINAFYVSKNSYNDWKEFNLIISKMFEKYNIRCRLTHIKDVSGRYATIKDLLDKE